MKNTVLLLAATIAVPLLLVILRAIFAWRFQRALRRSMGDSVKEATTASGAQRDSSATNRSTLTGLRIHDAGTVMLTDVARVLHDDASAITCRVRVVFIAAALVFTILASCGLAGAFAVNVPADARVVAVYLVQALILAILSSVLALSARQVLMLAGGYLLVGLVATFGITTSRRAMTVVSAEAELFLLIPMAGLALLLWRRLRPLLIASAAVVLYVGVNVGIGFWLVVNGWVDVPTRWWVWVLGAINLILAIVVLAWLLGRQSVRWPVLCLASASIVGIVIERQWSPDFPVAGMLVGIPLQVLQLFLVWLVFRVTVSLHDRHLLPPQVIHSHLAFGFVTAHFVVFLVSARNSGLFGQTAWPVVAIVAGFAVYVLFLHILLRRIRRDRETTPGKRLLFLRAFGSTRGPERLLDTLEDTWRRVGRINLIAASDLAVRTVGSSMIQAFLVRRADVQFLRTEQEVSRRLGQLRSSLEGDLRYPINELYCSGDTWQHAVRQLAPESDAVLMDLRGFTRRNRGCVFELSELVRSVPLARVVLLADRTTDLRAVEETAMTASAQRSAASVRQDEPQLSVLLCARSSKHNAEALFGLLVEAAVKG